MSEKINPKEKVDKANTAIKNPRKAGTMKGKFWLADDWDSPETNAEIAKLFNESKIFPDEE